MDGAGWVSPSVRIKGLLQPYGAYKKGLKGKWGWEIAWCQGGIAKGKCSFLIFLFQQRMFSGGKSGFAPLVEELSTLSRALPGLFYLDGASHARTAGSLPIPTDMVETAAGRPHPMGDARQPSARFQPDRTFFQQQLFWSSAGLRRRVI